MRNIIDIKQYAVEIFRYDWTSGQFTPREIWVMQRYVNWEKAKTH